MESEKTTTKQQQTLKTNMRLSTMKAALFSAPRKIDIVSVPIPVPSDDEVRIKMEGCGICGSDLPVWQGREWFTYPISPGAPGHEGFGIIECMGKNVRGFHEGDRVTMLSYHAYAEYDIAKASEIVKLPNSVEDHPFPGEPLGCAMNIFRRSDVKRNDIVAIIGTGFIGNLLVQLCKAAGATVIAISQRETSLKMAFESGADHIIQMDDHNRIIKRIHEITNNNACSRVFEVTGKQWPLDIAGDIVAIRGRIIIAGYHQDGVRQINMQNWNWKGIDVINAHERDPAEYIKGMKDAILAIENKVINANILYTHEYSLENIGEAFEKINSRGEGVLKLLIKI